MRRIANLCCGHLACQREAIRVAERAWDEGRAAERRDWEFTFDITTPDEDRQPWPNPYWEQQ